MDLLLLAAIFFSILSQGWCQQQYFRITPKDSRVLEGGEIVIQCEVSNLAGRVQWTKDGYALGFSAVLPGFPRYSVVGDARNGIYNLKILNASLEDDAEYQCQVGPMGANKAIRANAKLSVISPPTAIEILGYSGNSPAKVEVRENQELSLECQVKNSKPAARIVWYRGSIELKLDKREDRVTEVEGTKKKGKRFDVSSKISLTPGSEDDSATYTCEARHEALPLENPLRYGVKLSVLYPPGMPYIEGYTEGETMRRGQNIELICRSRGGNPPAQLIWYRNGEQINMAYRTSTRVSENIYSFTAEATDNKATYRCEASNIMSPAPLKTEVTLTVLFAPAQVLISGPTEARVGETVPLTCSTAASNPPAEVKWLVGGRQIRNATQRTYPDPQGGWITVSNTTAVMAMDQRSLVVICHGINKQLTENVVATHTINILYPPGQPMITGYTPGTAVAAGTVVKMSCISSGGNPLATLSWFKNDKKINAAVKPSDKSVSSEVTILANVTDNEAIYKCEATNPAMEIPMFETVKLSVHFPPDHVRIRVEPSELRANTEATLHCDASSSNPPAELSWWCDGIKVIESTTNTSKPGLHGGTVSSIEMKLKVTPDMDGKIFTCQAVNQALQRSAHDAFTMNVMYAPVWSEEGGEVTGPEGHALVIAASASGRPQSLLYTWTRDRSPLRPSSRVLIDGPLLNFTSLDRSDTGTYSCEASNSEGSSVIHYNLTVHYSANIVEVSEGVLTKEKEDAMLWCRSEGSPLTQDHVSWKRSNMPDMALRSSVTWQNNTSYLTLRKVTKEDIGSFQCVANNGLGNESVKDVFLNVRHKPEMDQSPALSKAASNNGDSGKLICRVSSAPPANFTWSREGSVISSDFHKYLIDYKQIDAVHFESILKIRNVEVSDYGRYECIARNQLGFASATVRLSVTSIPDVPSQLRVLNSSHDSLTLGWDPGFDGGLSQSFRLRYKPAHQQNANYKYEDTGNASVYTVSNLELGTQYVFSVMSQNRLGQTRYLPDTLKATTSSPVSVVPASSTDLPLAVAVAVLVTAAVLLCLNAVIIACFIYQKKKRAVTKTEQGASEQGSNKSATIEMYAPSSYNETVTGETLSSVSEKSESYSDSNAEYAEDQRKTPANTYLIEQIDYPFQYPVYDVQHPIKEPDPILMPRNNYLSQNGGTNLSVGVDPGYFGPVVGGGDPRYIAYPPPVQFAGPPMGHLTAPRGPAPVPPPDVTVLSAPPPPLMSTFNSYEHDAHLV